MFFFPHRFKKNKLTHQFTTNFRPPQIPVCKGNRYVIGDIHGCINTLKKLIENKIAPSTDDQIFFLGDYIDRGPSSKAVLDYILLLKKQNISIYGLMGNHEWMLLEAIAEGEGHTKDFLTTYKSMDLLENNTIPTQYIDFLMNTYFFIQLETIYLVHGGFNMNKKNPLKDYSPMLWQRGYQYISPFFKGKTIIHGHTPTLLTQISTAVKEKNQVIPLDNGCVFEKENIYGMGSLCCININHFTLIKERNCEL